MRYASTYDKNGDPVVAEVQGDLLVPLAGLTELGGTTTAEVLPRGAGECTAAHRKQSLRTFVHRRMKGLFVCGALRDNGLHRNIA